jgi:hypothetical protein
MYTLARPFARAGRTGAPKEQEDRTPMRKATSPSLRALAAWREALIFSLLNRRLALPLSWRSEISRSFVYRLQKNHLAKAFLSPTEKLFV